jgi:NTE family protein
MTTKATRAERLADAPFSLALSAGFFGFFSHTGLLLALEERDLRPARVVGVSAGALAGGLWSAGLPAAAIRDELLGLRRDDFWDPGLPWGGLLRGKKFGAKLADVLGRVGIDRIEACPVPFSAVVHDVVARRPLALSQGSLAVAIRASCTVPLMFQPMRIDGRIIVDGGVSDRIGETALVEGDGAPVLLHFLPSRRRFRLRAGEATPIGVAGRPTDVLVTPDLPRLGPFALRHAAQAVERTHAFAAQWLDAPA